MKLPGRTLGVVASAAGGGLVTLGVAVVSLRRSPSPDVQHFVLFGFVSALIFGTWVWPLIMYRDGQSEAFNLDEASFVIMALLAPSYAAVLAFALAGAAAEVVRRHTLVKSIFNWGQVVSAAGLGVLVTHVLAPPTPTLTVRQLAAAIVGAVVFSVVNTSAMAAIVATLGSCWRTAIDGIGIRLRLAGSCVAIAILSSLAISAYRWSVPLALLPLLILRQVLAGHFRARHDRTRMLGLFNAALEANRSLGDGDPLDEILQSARSLLRCPDATLRDAPPGAADLGAGVAVNGQPSWLVVSGRGRTEPFDSADATLLEALAAVGAGALTNAHLYREGRLQRERLAAITSSLGEGVCALDRAGRVTFVNPAAAGMLGWDASGPFGVPGPGDDGGEGPATPDVLSAPALQAMQTRETVRTDDTEFQRRDGTRLPVSVTASAILDGDQVAGAVIVFGDITERREAENAIRVARDQAIEASRLKSQFLANTSHEIRTPMNGVLGLTRMLLETDVDDEQRKYLLALRESGENLMVIINDILDFSKIEAGKLELEDVDFDLRALLASVTDAMTVPAHEKGLLLHLHVDPGLPQRVGGDPVRLRQVLTNLVGNAIKFTHVGVVTIVAGALGGGRVRITVTDTGIGIDPSARATVLGAFGQADSSTTRRYGGTGLGLAICSHLVGMMGGVLDFASQPGQGSTFWVELPLREAQSVAPAEPAPPRSSNHQWETSAAPVSADDSGPTAEPSRPRVLIADDAPVNQMVASREVELLGYRVDVVTNGEEALRAVQQDSYDAVLMDCLMPVMDGYEATQRIRRLEGGVRATPIIAMTASAMAGDREKCLLAGMDDYLSKPLNRNLLAAALAHATQAESSQVDRDQIGLLAAT